MAVLRAILAWSIVSTALHYTHNVVAIDEYPQATWISDTGVRVAIVVAWPLLTALAVWAYRQYERGNLRQAHVALAVYSLTGLSSLGHFAIDSVDLPAFWMATIASDGLAGAAVLGFAVWSELRRTPERRAAAA